MSRTELRCVSIIEGLNMNSTQIQKISHVHVLRVREGYRQVQSRLCFALLQVMAVQRNILDPSALSEQNVAAGGKRVDVRSGCWSDGTGSVIGA